MRSPFKRPPYRLAVLCLPVALAVPGIAWTATPASSSTSTVNVVGYSVASKVYKALEAAFGATTTGKGVTFTNSFGASTTQAKDVVAGQPADVVNFSQVPDLQLLVNAKLVSPTWDTAGAGKAEGGMVSDSVVVIAVRPGNPLHLTGWNSLTHQGLKIVTPDPISSGSARWNLLGAYESQIVQGKSATQARSYLNSLVKRVVAEPSSGSKALSAFLAGTGNVLLAYESDARAAVAAKKPVQIVVPQQNILIQTPAALTTTGSKNPGAEAFFKFLFSAAGQRIFAANGFRPTLSSVAVAEKSKFYQYPPKLLTTIADLGGWTHVISKFFSPNGIITEVEAANGWTS